MKGSLLKLCSLGLLAALLILYPAWAGEPDAWKNAPDDTSSVLIWSISADDHTLIEIVEESRPCSSAAEKAQAHACGMVNAGKAMWRAAQTVVRAVASLTVRLVLSVGMIVVHWVLASLGAG